MHKRALVVAVLSLALGMYGCSSDDDTTGNNPGGEMVPPPQFCAQAPNGQLCSFIPHDILESFENGYSQLSAAQQRPFDNFSWQTFVALNWPATADGTPLDVPITEAKDAPRVWQSYADSFSVFNVTTEEGLTARPDPCVALGRPDLPILQLIAKSNQIHASQGSILQATEQPLIDRNVNFTLFDIRLNPVEVNYVTTNGLNTLGGQFAFMQAGKTVSFPMGDYADNNNSTGGSVGAMEIKTAWRILDASKGDTPERFFTMQSLVFVPAGSTEDNQAFCFEATLGLVGMHIIQRTTGPTNFDADWIWSTFEHIDNAPVATNAANPAVFQEGPAVCDPPSTSHVYSYFDPSCMDCGTNLPPPTPSGGTYLWADSPPYARLYGTSNQNKQFGTQVVRCWQPFPEVVELNTAFQKQLKGTVFANYQLVGTQWQGGVEDPESENGNIPRYFSNAVLETFIQNNASCLDCHKFATTAFMQDANFSFLLGLPLLQAHE